MNCCGTCSVYIGTEEGVDVVWIGADYSVGKWSEYISDTANGPCKTEAESWNVT